MPRIGFIGLGNMGGNMAARYLADGYDVLGVAQSRDRARALIDQGTGAEKARAELGWEPSHPGLVEEFRNGSYRKVEAA